MFRSRTRTSILALAAATAIFTAGCGVDQADDGALGAVDINSQTNNGTTNQQGGPPPLEPGEFEGTGGVVYLRDAADATASVKTMSMEMDISMTGVPMYGDVSITAEGSIDTPNKLLHMSMDMTDMLEASGTSGAGFPDDAGVIEMIVDDDVTYMKSSLFAMMPGADDSKPWFQAPSAEVSESDTFGQSSNDPREFLEFLRNSGSDVTSVGTEELRGVETTHLQTVLDPEALAESSSEGDSEEMEASLDDLGASGITEIPVEVWVDNDGMVRKMIMTMDMSDSGDPSMDGVSMVISVEMFDFDEPVDIVVPDPSEVQELDPAVLED